MNIYLKKIDKNNYKECINLKLTSEQERYVSSNLLSLVQTAYEDDFYSLGIYNNDMMVGFILYDYDLSISGWSMSRFMIDYKYQNQGIGEKALRGTRYENWNNKCIGFGDRGSKK